jgi:hypothetical protein
MGMLDLLPTPAKLYLESVVGGKREPITEADFSPEELAEMQKLIGGRAQGGITYADYNPAAQPRMAGLLTPAGRVATSLGQFNYQADPQGTVITDEYDFNPTYKDESLLLKALSILGSAGFSGLHMLGEHALPAGKGRPVKIRLPKR